MSAAHYGIAIFGLISLLVVYRGLRRNSAIRQLNGPPSPSWLFGNMAQLMLPPYGRYEFDWQKIYGPVYRFKGCFGQDRLMISDPVALHYILNSPQFKLGPVPENLVHLLYPKGSIMSVDREEDHKRIRAVLGVGFTAAAIRNYIPIFERAAQMISEQLEDSSVVPINIAPIFNHATLGTTSEATLGYSVDDLGEEFVSNNIEILTLASTQSATHILGEAIGSKLPTFVWRAAEYLPTATCKVIRRAKYLADELGIRVVQGKRSGARQGLEIDTDLFGQLLQQHDSTSAKHSMTEKEIVAQTGMMILAGQETTSTTLSFGLIELAKAPELQEKLRAEIHATMGSARASSVTYNSMPLLNAFIKEVLRMYPAEAIGERLALEDAVIPLGDGNISHLPVRKGQIVNLGFACYQRLESRWGKDAHEFRPSRWLDGGVFKGEAIGPYANLLSFLGGPRTCLGWRFAILEMQVILSELVGKFSFALPVEGAPRTRFAGTLQPIMPNGQKGALVLIRRLM
ncbi:cytochrome P450 [Mycena olivaceomarginata]|nr:cytochrome P450 [Mycena olivaceomarginata]